MPSPVRPSQIHFYIKMCLTTSVICLALLISFSIGLYVYEAWYEDWSGYSESLYVSDGVCNIAVVPVVGEIITVGNSVDETDLDNQYLVSADTVVANIRAAVNDPYILGIMTRIDSPGGEPVASEIISEELLKTSLPNAALVLGQAASGGYLIASGADTIVASRFSDVGSIGVNMSYLQNTERNANEGLEYVQLTSAEYKDSGSPDRILTEAERALFERDLELYHQVFVSEVAKNRRLPVEKVQALADGSSMAAELALAAGLIDALGNEDTARAWFAEQLDITPEQVIFCPEF